MSRCLALASLTVFLLIVSFCPASAAAPQPADAPPPAPHPLLSDIRIRRAVAYCTDKAALVASVYPFLDSTQQNALLMDTFLPKTHWAYSAPLPEHTYPHNPAAGAALLDQAGWTLAPGRTYRTDATGYELAIGLRTTTAQFRQVWASALEAQLRDCGIRLVRDHVPASWWFGNTTGLARRDFELAAYAWVGQLDPAGGTFYACDQIPLPDNGWRGQNYMGWCNPSASDAVIAATSTLDRATRVAQYRIVQQEFARDIPTLPAFQRAQGEAWSNRLAGLRVSPTEYGTKSARDWTVSAGDNVAVLVTYDEPGSLFGLVESAAVTRMATDLGAGFLYTTYDYDYQPALQDPLSTLESGLAAQAVVEVQAGDKVLSSEGQVVTLAPGVKVLDADGQVVTFTGGTVRMKRLVVTYQFKPFTWSDGVTGAVANFELGARIHCDRESGAWDYSACDAVDELQFGPGLQYRIVWLPGWQIPDYLVAPFPPYPGHRVLSDGRKLADVPAREWAGLPEVAERPLSYGPFYVTEWRKGERLIFARNPHFSPAPALAGVEMRFADSQTAVNWLLSGQADYVDGTALGAGEDLERALAAARLGQVQAAIVPNPTWEHIDFNLELFARGVARELGLAGGTIENPLGVQVVVPPGALTGQVTLYASTYQTSPYVATPLPAAKFNAVTVRTVEGASQPLTQPMALTVGYDGANVAARGVREERLNLHVWNGASWEAGLLPCAGCSRDQDADRLILSTDRLGHYLVAGELRTYLPVILR